MLRNQKTEKQAPLRLRCRAVRRASGRGRMCLAALIVLASAACIESEARAASATVAIPCQGKPLDPYELWKGVSNTEQAERFLLEQYKLHGSVDSFVDWLRCQDFGVTIFRGSVLNKYDKNTKIEFGFLVAGKNRKPLWYLGIIEQAFGIVWAQTFEMYLDESGKVIGLKSGHTVE